VPKTIGGAAPTIDIGILTIRDDEFRALLTVFPEGADTYHGRTREYAIRKANAGDGAQYTIGLLRQIEQGNGEAQEAARDLLEDLEPSLLLVVGIAGGLPSDDVTLGDVILSTRVNDYSVEARKARSKPTYNLSGGPIDKSLAAAVSNLPARERELGDWTKDLPPRPPVKWQGTGLLYGPKRWQNELRDKLEGHFGKNARARVPVYASGPIASSDRLVKDPKVLFPWIESARALLAVEMESGGAYRGARDRCPMLAIRGLSDVVGLKRHDAWTKYACASAAAFTRAFLRTRPVPPREVGEALTALAARTAASLPARTDTIYTNLVPLLEYPEHLYIADATAGTYKQAWAMLRARTKAYVPGAWVLHEGNLYSFEDPESSRLSKICDAPNAEEHRSVEWAVADDEDKRRLFVQLLSHALRDDMWSKGVRFFADDDVFAFSGWPDEAPRTHRYRNVREYSEVTVVSHYTRESKRDGRTFAYLRHNAFRGRFRRFGSGWHLEVSPTYRFTYDGKNKDLFHEANLSGIKRLEKNRAVVSQMLLWSDILKAPGRLLRFGAVEAFTVPGIDEDEASELGDVAPTADGTHDEA
jgi:nucleoside phosphorylase